MYCHLQDTQELGCSGTVYSVGGCEMESWHMTAWSPHGHLLTYLNSIYFSVPPPRGHYYIAQDIWSSCLCLLSARSKGLWCPHTHPVHLILWDKVPHWPGFFLSRLGWLDNEPLCAHLPYARIRGRHQHAWLLHSSPHAQQQDVLTELQPQCSLDWPWTCDLPGTRSTGICHSIQC